MATLSEQALNYVQQRQPASPEWDLLREGKIQQINESLNRPTYGSDGFGGDMYNAFAGAGDRLLTETLPGALRGGADLLSPDNLPKGYVAGGADYLADKLQGMSNGTYGMSEGYQDAEWYNPQRWMPDTMGAIPGFAAQLAGGPMLAPAIGIGQMFGDKYNETGDPLRSLATAGLMYAPEKLGMDKFFGKGGFAGKGLMEVGTEAMQVPLEGAADYAFTGEAPDFNQTLTEMRDGSIPSFLMGAAGSAVDVDAGDAGRRLKSDAMELGDAMKSLGLQGVDAMGSLIDPSGIEPQLANGVLSSVTDGGDQKQPNMIDLGDATFDDGVGDQTQTNMIYGPNAANADLGALDRAAEMKASGASEDEIFAETKWWLDHPDGVPRFELSDKDSSINPDNLNRRPNQDLTYMPDVLESPNIYENYPELGGVRADANISLNESGQFDPNASIPTIKMESSDTEGLRGTGLHEVQHGIQKIEGMNDGGSPATARDQHINGLQKELDVNDGGNSVLMDDVYSNRIDSLGRIEELNNNLNLSDEDFISANRDNPLLKNIDSVVGEDREELVKWTKKNIKQDAKDEPFYFLLGDKSADFSGIRSGLESKLAGIKSKPTHNADKERANKIKDLEGGSESDFDLYQRLGGETEARLSDDSKNMSQEEMDNDPFFNRYDTPIENQMIVNTNKDFVSNSETPKDQKVYQISDGTKWYQQDDGTVTDTPNAADSSDTFDSYAQMKEEFDDDVWQVGDELAERKQDIKFQEVEDFMGFMETPTEEAKYLAELNKQKRNRDRTKSKMSIVKPTAGRTKGEGTGDNTQKDIPAVSQQAGETNFPPSTDPKAGIPESGTKYNLVGSSKDKPAKIPSGNAKKNKLYAKKQFDKTPVGGLMHFTLPDNAKTEKQKGEYINAIRSQYGSYNVKVEEDGTVVAVKPDKHLGVETRYLVDSGLPYSGKTPGQRSGVVKDMNPVNADKTIIALDSLAESHPDPLASEEAWIKFENELTNSDRVFAAPHDMINLVNDMDGWVERHSQLSGDQLKAANEGFKTVEAFSDLYASGEADAGTTGQLMLWGMLSRMLSAHPHESAFIDAATSGELDGFIQSAIDGEWTDADVKKYLDWSGSVIGEFSPGKSGTSNMNDFGKYFLKKMSAREPDGRSKLEHLHELLADKTKSSSEVRRGFYKIAKGVGIKNKVFSFMMLMSGREDVMVMDRIQINTLWDTARYGRLMYDDVASMFDGGQGIARYEALERSIGKRVEELYKRLGREGSIGRYHWESWVLNSGQIVAHPTMEGMVNDITGVENPYANLGAPEGRYHQYAYGARYGKDESGKPQIWYNDSIGDEYIFETDQFKKFITEVKDVKNGVVPKGFNVSEYREKGYPWYEAEEVNRQKLDSIVKKFSKGKN